MGPAACVRLAYDNARPGPRLLEETGFRRLLALRTIACMLASPGSGVPAACRPLSEDGHAAADLSMQMTQRQHLVRFSVESLAAHPFLPLAPSEESLPGR